MRIAICDDEEPQLLCLMELMTQYQQSRGTELHCRTFQNGIDLLCGMKGGEYDLVFLDILMPGFSGIGAARELRELDKSVKLIFLTSSPDFAVESYSVGTYHYLLKPATEAELFPLLDKVRSELSVQEEGLLLRDRSGVVRVPFARLEYVEVMNKTVSFHMTDGVVREVTAALSDFEEDLLERPEFLKIHRSYLANLSHIQAISTKGAVTRTGHTIPVSRLQYNQIKDSYLAFLFESEAKPPMPDPPAKETELRPQCHPWQILLVDDEPSDLALWAGVLRTHGCVAQTAQSGETAVQMAAEGKWDLVLLDVMMPGEDCFLLCKQLHERTSAPVIFLSSHTDTDKQMQGFFSGGVDYITKDTPAELFWIKVETRIKLTASDRTQLRFGSLLIDLTARKVFLEEQELVLTPVEFDLLWRLSEHTERVFSPEEIFGAVWGSREWDGGQTVQIHMSRLRRKLEKACDAHHFIETVWGQGYRFVPWSDC